MPPILIWNNYNYTYNTSRIGYPDYPMIVPNTTCPFNCTFTNDRKFEVNASTIIFFLHEFCPIDVYPQNRREDQNYMMYTVECPGESLKYYDRKIMTDKWFNSSATYLYESSVHMPYDELTKITENTPTEYIWDQKEVLAKIKKKTKFAFQAVTRCKAKNDRELITKKIGELINIDTVGPCFNILCDNECYQRGLEEHFFHLAFENNNCHHYVTEKFWNSLRAITIPVVLTRSVFKGLDLPPNAFIAVDDFLSVNELVEHLKALRNNTEEYLKHFEWTKIYTKRRKGADYSPICKICEYATKHFEEKTKNVINLNKFWNEENCQNDFVKKFLRLK